MIPTIAQLSYLGPPISTRPCRRCGRVLHDPVSILAGAGPVCRRYLPETTMSQPTPPATVMPAAEPTAPTYLSWFDATKDRAPDLRIAPALQRHHERNGCPATVVIASPIDAAALAPLVALEVRALDSVPRHTYLVGTVPQGTLIHGGAG